MSVITWFKRKHQDGHQSIRKYPYGFLDYLISEFRIGDVKPSDCFVCFCRRIDVLPAGGKMASFNLDSHFLTGLTDVDEQHYRLVELINRFGDALGQTQDEFEAEFVAVFNELIEYTHYHFQEEESLMEKVGVDPRHVASQKSAHRQFVE